MGGERDVVHPRAVAAGERDVVDGRLAEHPGGVHGAFVILDVSEHPEAEACIVVRCASGTSGVIMLKWSSREMAPAPCTS